MCGSGTGKLGDSRHSGRNVEKGCGDHERMGSEAGRWRRAVAGPARLGSVPLGSARRGYTHSKATSRPRCSDGALLHLAGTSGFEARFLKASPRRPVDQDARPGRTCAATVAMLVWPGISRTRSNDPESTRAERGQHHLLPEPGRLCARSREPLPLGEHDSRATAEAEDARGIRAHLRSGSTVLTGLATASASPSGGAALGRRLRLGAFLVHRDVGYQLAGSTWKGEAANGHGQA